MNPDSGSITTDNLKIFRLISYLLVFLMLACVVMTSDSLIRNALPGWGSGIIAGITLFVVVDRLFMHPRLKALNPFSSEWTLTIGTQWFVILLFIRFILSYAHGLDSFTTDLSLLARGYLATFFSAEFVVTALLAVLVWYLAGQFLELLDVIGLDQAQA